MFKILIVEDNNSLRAVMTEVLQQHGCAVQAVADAESLCESVAVSLFDMALLDLNLPGENGLSLSKRLRQIFPRLGIIMVTARTQVSDKVCGYESGADIYLTKPVEVIELIASVQALGRRLALQNQFDSANYLDKSWRLDLLGNFLWNPKQQRVEVTRSEAQILHAMLMAPNAELEHWQLLGVLNKAIDERGKAQLEVAMSRLRSKLIAAGAPASVLRNARSHGYRLHLPLILI